MSKSFNFEFFMSQVEQVRNIKDDDKIQISLILYGARKSPCILKKCKNRDLSAVYEKLKEIKHQNLVVIYDYIYEDGDTYVVEEYINGMTLREIMKQYGIFREDQTIKIIKDVCKGLKMLHSQNPPIIHNDIKTSNIMIKDDGMIKLFDFDIARLYRMDATKNTRLFGTEEYAAPEHFGYGQSEQRTDIYSLGVTMHEMLTGEILDINHRITYEGILKNILEKCVKIDKEQRWDNIDALMRELNDLKKQMKLHKSTQNKQPDDLIKIYEKWGIEDRRGGLLSIYKEAVKKESQKPNKFVDNLNADNENAEVGTFDIFGNTLNIWDSIRKKG